MPDRMYGWSIAEACDIHDWMYEMGETNADKAQADETFLVNLLRIAQPSWFPLRILRRLRALKYYEAVRDFGDTAFWAGKEPVS